MRETKTVMTVLISFEREPEVPGSYVTRPRAFGERRAQRGVHVGGLNQRRGSCPPRRVSGGGGAQSPRRPGVLARVAAHPPAPAQTRRAAGSAGGAPGFLSADSAEPILTPLGHSVSSPTGQVRRGRSREHPRPTSGPHSSRAHQLLPWGPPVGHGALLGHSRLPALTPGEAAARGNSSPWRLRAEPAPVGEGACPRCVIRSSSSAIPWPGSGSVHLLTGPGVLPSPPTGGDTEAQQLG